MRRVRGKPAAAPSLLIFTCPYYLPRLCAIAAGEIVGISIISRDCKISPEGLVMAAWVAATPGRIVSITPVSYINTSVIAVFVSLIST